MLKKYYRCLWLFPFKLEEKREALRAAPMDASTTAIGATSANS